MLTPAPGTRSRRSPGVQNCAMPKDNPESSLTELALPDERGARGALLVPRRKAASPLSHSERECARWISALRWFAGGAATWTASSTDFRRRLGYQSSIDLSLIQSAQGRSPGGGVDAKATMRSSSCAVDTDSHIPTGIHRLVSMWYRGGEWGDGQPA